ncbi:MAG: hypothetical protein VYB59_11900 [Pseudomonadota bacterium]|nr:hypothetical protein [Pseudomonadota bacterium]
MARPTICGNKNIPPSGGMMPYLIQARYIGYPHFTGLPFIDNLIAEDIVTPTLAENLFTETLLRVPNVHFDLRRTTSRNRPSSLKLHATGSKSSSDPSITIQS